MTVEIAPMFVFEAGGPHDLPSPMDGYYFFEKDTIYIPVVMTWHTAIEGKGYVGRLIDAAKAQASEVVFPTVLSRKLAGMLLRRGFELEIREFDGGTDEPVECLTWRADRTSARQDVEEKINMSPVTVLMRVIHRGDAHVRVAVWAGRNVGARGKAGELTFRTDEWEAIKDELALIPLVFSVEDEPSGVRA